MKFILGTVISLFSFFMLYFFVAIFSPDFYEVEKTQDFSQSRQIVWHKFSRFRNWESWLPWKSQSDTIHYTYSGISGRAGAKVAWHSQEFGSGSRMVTSIEPFVELEYVLRLNEKNSVTKISFDFLTTNLAQQFLGNQEELFLFGKDLLVN